MTRALTSGSALTAGRIIMPLAVSLTTLSGCGSGGDVKFSRSRVPQIERLFFFGEQIVSVVSFDDSRLGMIKMPSATSLSTRRRARLVRT